MLRKLPQPAKTNIQQSSDDMSISNYKNKKMKNDSNVLISSLDLSVILLQITVTSTYLLSHSNFKIELLIAN